MALTIGNTKKKTLSMGTNTGRQGSVSPQGGAISPQRTISAAQLQPAATAGRLQPAGYPTGGGQVVPWATSSGTNALDQPGGNQQLGGNTGGSVAVDPAYAAEQARIAAENARKNDLKNKSRMTLDELMAIYDQLVSQIQNVGKDQSGRINKSFDEKILEQIQLMNEGMYETDASAAASNLADSSFRSFDRGKVRKAKEANERVLNDGRQNDLSEIGRMVATDTARYQADKGGLATTRSQLDTMDNVDELQKTYNTLDATKRGAIADKAKYQPRGAFVSQAAKLGNYDTSALEQSMQSVVASASATPATKQAAIDDLLNGTTLDDGKKNELKNKYIQQIG